MEKLPQILTNYDSQISRYPQAYDFQILQQKNFWLANEVNVSKDIQYILTEIDENSKHGILETLKLFTIYETKADCFWSEVIKNMFPDPDIKAMATYFGGIELSIHRNAYNELNKLLNKYNDDFYNSYKQSDFLVERMKFIDDHLESDDNLTKIATLCFAEGVILFSNFAFLMSFRANGHNLLPNVGNVIKFSAKDEDLHSLASSWLFRTLKHEMIETYELGLDFEEKLYNTVIEMAKVVKEHEFKIIESIFSKGSIPTITKEELETFILSRINVVLNRMGYDPVYKVDNCNVTKWFDKILINIQNNDFFAGQGSGYQRDWKKEDYVW